MLRKSYQYTLCLVSASTTLCFVSIIINTFVSKLHSSTKMKKVQIICLEMSPQPLQVSIHNVDFALQNYKSTPGDNIKKNCKIFQATFKCKKDVNISHYTGKCLQEISFLSVKIRQCRWYFVYLSFHQFQLYFYHR